MHATLRIAVFVVVFVPVAANAATAGNAADGERYAKAHCAECHTVDKSGEISPDFAAPRFVDVANTPGMTERAIAVWLQTSHPTMPDLMIPEPVRDSLIAYIMSLKSLPQQ
ncbi:cytochrome C [Hyphomicrobium sp. LHD-15]|uniref:cytochrome C n=1 Tax=Hyphomicrobium sp. LHD-15 TaxID=3072142 RepID=UPI00280FE1A4|nr:cytochrome C [Hyphomicrobium sp. LHD-15]MDQ8700663.1 cytochrome C [Hyphomicrobium sp. LHD-15]